MKINLSYKLLGTLLFSLSILLSCTSSNENSSVDNRDSMLITFSLDVKSPEGTRVDDDNTWGGVYPSVLGTDFETKIELESLIIFAYTSDGKFVAELPILHRDEVNGVASFTCALPKTLPYEAGKSYRYMIVTNSTNKNYGISYDENGPCLDKLVFTPPFTESIPMWGVKTYQFPATVPANRLIDLGEISVLRATSKVGVKLSRDVEAEGYKITGLKLNYANSNGFSVPSNWNIESSTETMTHDEVFRPNVAAGLMTDVSAMTMGATTGAYNFYVPETMNNSQLFTPADGQPQDISIAVTLEKDGETIEFPYENGIRFCKYNNGEATDDYFNIIRNHFYEFTITAVNVGLKMNVKVADWVDEPVWNLDFSAPIHTKLLTAPDTNAAAPTTVPTMCFDNSDASGEAGAFVGYFMMESPEGMTWRPTLANASTTDYDVRVYKTDGIDPEYNILVIDNAIPAESGYFYKIVVVPLNPNNEGNVVKLGLTYTADWNAEANPLLIINKGVGETPYYYPWDGSDKKDAPDIHWISIRQGAPLASVNE